MLAAALIVVAVAAGSTYSVLVERERLMQVNKSAMLRTAGNAGAAIDRLIVQANQRLKHVANYLNMMSPEHAVNESHRDDDGDPAMRGFVLRLVDSTGAIVAPLAMKGRSVAHLPEVQMALRLAPGEFSYGDVRHGLDGEEGPFIPISMRVGANPHGVEVVYGLLPMNLVLAVLGATAPGPNGSAGFVSDRGVILSRFPYRASAIGSLVSDDLLRVLSEGRSSGIIKGVSPIDGVERILVFQRVGSLPFHVFVAMPPNELVALNRSKELIVLVINLLFAVAVMSGAWMVTGQFRRAATMLMHLREAKAELEELATILRDMGAGIAVVAPDGRILWANDAFRRMLPQAWSESQDDGSGHLGGVILSSDGGPVSAQSERLSQAIASGTSVDAVFPLRRDERGDHWLRCIGVPLPLRPGEAVARSVLVITDATDQVAAQAMAERSQRLAALGRLAGAIAHDTNNLLSIIALNLDVLAETLLTDDQADLVKGALSAIRRGGDLTRPLLAFAQRGIDAAQTMDIAPVMEKLVPLLGTAMPRNVTLVTDLQGRGVVRGDEGGLESAVTNLVINARDAVSVQDDGRITIESANVRIDPSSAERLDLKPGDYVRIDVRDNGPGMTDEVLARIMEPFFTTKGDKGTGLGLPSAYGYARQCGGTLDIVSAPGCGTVASLYFPLVQAMSRKDGHHATGRDGTVSLRDKVVLIVEDDPMALTAMQRMVSSTGAKVFTALDEDHALARLATSHVDLFLLDVRLGHSSNGVDLAHRIRKVDPDAPIVFVTGDPGPHFQAKLGTLGTSNRVAVVAKPFTRHDLMVAIDQVMNGCRHQGEEAAQDGERNAVASE